MCIQRHMQIKPKSQNVLDLRSGLMSAPLKQTIINHWSKSLLGGQNKRIPETHISYIIYICLINTLIDTADKTVYYIKLNICDHVCLYYSE